MSDDKVKAFLQNIINSVGLKRKLTALFQVLSTVIASVPALSGYASLLQSIASYLGIVGIGHAAVAGTLSKNRLSTVASFFSALVLATQTVPQLQPYAAVIQAIATLLGLFVHANVQTAA